MLVDFLYQLKFKKIYLWLDGDSIRYSFDKKIGFSSDSQKKIAECKSDIILILRYNSIFSEEKARSNSIYRLPEKYWQKKLCGIQSSIFTQAKLDDRHDTYNVPIFIKIDTKNISLVEKAYREVLQNNHILRMLIDSDMNIVFKNIDQIKFKHTILDQSELEGYFQKVSKNNFDLIGNIFILCEIISVKDSQHIYLNLTHHHIITDALSVDLLVQQINKAYHGNLSINEYSYFDYVLYEQALKSQESCLQLLEKLAQQLDQVNIVHLNQKLLHEFDNQGESYQIKMKKSLWDKIQSLAQQEEISAYTLLLSTFYTNLLGYSLTQDFAIGITVSNRNIDLANVIGPFINTLPVLPNSKNGTFKDLSLSVHQQLLQLNENAHINLNDISALMKSNRNILDIMHVMFIMHNFLSPHEDHTAFEKIVFSDVNTEKFGLSITAKEEIDGLIFHVSFSNNLYSREYIDSIMNSYLSVLENINENIFSKPLPDLITKPNSESNGSTVNGYYKDYDLINKTILKYPGITSSKCYIEEYEVSNDSNTMIVSNTPAYLSGGDINITGHPTTLVEAILNTANKYPDKGLRYIDGYDKECFESYNCLYNKATSILAGLIESGISPGDVAVLQLNNSKEYFPALWACILGGIIPVTIAVTAQQKLLNSYDLLSSPVIITSHGLIDDLENLFEKNKQSASILNYSDLLKHTPISQIELPEPDKIAVYQLTSGSTGLSKCVQITHKGIVAHCVASKEINEYSEKDITLNWIPYDHVVPLITMHFKDVFFGSNQTIVNTNLILNKPLFWIELIDRYRVNHSWAPNFAFKLVADALSQKKNYNWDLSCLRVLMNAGEQVTLSVVNSFLKAVSPFGLNESVLQPAYGMAEICTAITYKKFISENPGFNIEANTVGKPLVFKNRAKKDTTFIIDVGPPSPGIELRVVDHQGTLLNEGVIGRLQAYGDVVTPGYLNNPKANEALLEDGWFDTGDLAFIKNGTLCITGRSKEVIIINGVNYYCYEIEDLVNEVDGVLPTYSAAIGVTNERSGSEILVVYYCCKEGASSEECQRKIREHLSEKISVVPRHVIEIDPKDFPKTTSGKIQRSQLKERFEKEYKNNFSQLIDLFSPSRYRAPLKINQVNDQSKILCILNAPLSIPTSESNIIYVVPGKEDRKLDDQMYSMDLSSDQHKTLLSTLIAEHNIQSIISSCYEISFILKFLPIIIELEVKHLIFITQISLSKSISEPIGTLSGIVKNIGIEKPNLSIKLMDFEKMDLKDQIHLASHEIYQNTSDPVVFYRNNERYIESLDCLYLEEKNKVNPKIQQGDLILIAGGNGGIGQLLVKHLLDTYSVKLLVLSRDAISFSLDHSNLLFLKADVTNADSIKNAVEKAEKHFSQKLFGVINLVGAVNESLFEHFSEESFLKSTNPKVRSTVELNSLLEKKGGGYFINFSSIISFFGSVGYSAYAAANSFVDLYTKYQNEKGIVSALNLSWSMWRDTGMSKGSHAATSIQRRGFEVLLPETALSLFDQIVRSSIKGTVFIGLNSKHIGIKRYYQHEHLKLEKRLIVEYQANQSVNQHDVEQYMRTQIPFSLLPDRFLQIGKSEEQKSFSGAQNELEQSMSKIWAEVLGCEVDSLSVDGNFFDLGGDSILLVRLKYLIQEQFHIDDLQTSDFFKYPTIRTLSSHLSNTETTNVISTPSREEDDIALIGLSGAFSSSHNVDEFWNHLLDGHECLDRYSVSKALKIGVPGHIAKHENYMSVSGNVPNIDLFDAKFWGFSSNDAQLLDPQIRKFLEHAWWALEQSGYIRERSKLNISLFSGVSNSFYFKNRIENNPLYTDQVSNWELQSMNGKDYLATRTSYHLGLTGTAININTGCSSALVAIIEACKALRSGTTDIALAGASSLFMPENHGYVYHDNVIFSNDGHCHVFDKSASGTVGGAGVGVVVLKRLKQAQQDNDNILAVIKGYATNNDGNRKVGYTAPSVMGQVECIRLAQVMAGVTPDQVSYVECHGTGTSLGDPVEIAALHEVFSNGKKESKYDCVLGAVKANIGHADSAAGLAGLIKVCQMLKHKRYPKQINYQAPNPECHFDKTHFSVLSESENWQVEHNRKRIAGVSSFGIGGTNAHIILEEYPSQSLSSNTDSNRLVFLPISAKSSESVNSMLGALEKHIEKNKNVDLIRMQYTLAHCREVFDHRQCIVGSDHKSLVSLLKRKKDSAKAIKNPQIIFSFPGQGSQFKNMGKSLYKTEPVYQKAIDRCDEYCNGLLKSILFEENHDINKTIFSQPALFATGYALAKLVESKGIQATAYIGHSIGEYVAATLAGVWSLEDAIKIVLKRAELMQSMLPGTMLAVHATPDLLKDLLLDKMQIAVYNAPDYQVVSGPIETIHKFSEILEKKHIFHIKLHTSHAFHSWMMDKAADEFSKYLTKFNFHKPIQEFISNVSGDFVDDCICSPEYWAEQIRSPVQFSSGVLAVHERYPNAIYLELGPGNVLTTLMKQHNIANSDRLITTILPANQHKEELEVPCFYEALAQSWCCGVDLDWALLAPETENSQCDTDLPGYIFDQKRHWLDKPDTELKLKVIEESVQNAEEIEKEDTQTYDRNEDPIVRKVAYYFSEILGEHDIDIKESFFNLGGTSLSAIRLLTKINHEFKSNVKVRDIFEYNSVELISDLVKRSIGSFDYSSYIIEKIDDDDTYKAFPPSNIQQAYFIGRSNEFDLGNVSTHSYSEHQFKELDLDRLEKSYNKLIKRHLSLRTVFRSGMQQYLREVPYYKVHYYEVNTKEELKNLRAKYESKVYSPEKYPLFDVFVSYDSEYYRLHLSFDILLIDGHSFRLLFDEWTQYYNNLDLSLPPLQTTYRDYTLAKDKIRNSDLYAKAKQYWVRRADQYSFDMNLPMLKDSSEVLEPRFIKIKRCFKQKQWKEIKSKAKSLNISPTSILLTLFGRTLTYWAGQEKICINMTLFNRLPLHPDINEIIGDFTVLELFNYQDFSIESAENKFKSDHQQLWMDIEQNVFDGIDFQRYVRKAKNIPSSQVLTPITFTCILDDDKSTSNMKNLINSSYMGETYSLLQTSQVWLDNIIFESDKGLEIEWSYVNELFDTAVMNKILDTYLTLLSDIGLTDWSKRLPQVKNPALSMIEAVNVASQPEPTDSIPTLIDRVCQTQNILDQIAVIDDQKDKKYSYDEILNASKQVAYYLHPKLSEDDSLVAVLAEKGVNQVISTLGIMRAGAAYLPLNYDWPVERINDILQKGGVNKILISENATKNTALYQHLKNNYHVFVIEETLQEQVEKVALPIIDSHDVAYVIFTSGSTGKPKGVTISHQGALNTILAVNDRFSIGNKDSILALSDLSFDLSVYDIFGLLLAGGSIVFPNQSCIKDAQYWRKLINTYQINVWNSVPLLADLLVNAINEDANALKSLRLYLLSGDKIPLSLLERLKKFSPKATVMSLGGATEGSIWSIWYEIKSVDPAWPLVPYGVAMPNQNMYVLNHSDEHTPYGVVGEIHIGGMGVALNYWNDQAKTDKSYFKHPTLGRLYRTGDLGKWNPKGYIEFVGRKDNQVKINGYRIELGEVEAQLLTNPDVREAVVIDHDIKQTNKKALVAYYIKNEESNDKNKGTVVQAWADVYDDIYDSLDNENYKFNFQGWVSSYTNEPIQNAAMREWLELTIKNIISLNPKKVLELGCGSGLILFNLIQDVSEYHATDISQQAISHIDKLIKTQHLSKKVTTEVGFAENVLERSQGKSFDTVIINSVTQHFPNICYLSDLITVFKDQKASFSRIYIGDIRDNRLSEVFHFSVMKFKGNEFTWDDVQKEATHERELLIHPAYFTELSRIRNITGIEILAKEGDYDTEMNRYRYDVVIHFDKDNLKSKNVNYKDFTLAMDVAGVIKEGGDLLCILYPIKSTYKDYVDYNTFSKQEIDSDINIKDIKSLTEIKAIAKEHGYNIKAYIDVARSGFYNLVIYKESKKIYDYFSIKYNENTDYSKYALANNPATSRIIEDPEFPKSLRNYMSQRLPEYMVPEHYIRLEHLPLTGNGKLDRDALPKPAFQETEFFVPARNKEEQQLCDIWQELLCFSEKKMGITDDFFKLGGDSITAIQIIGQIRKQMKISVNVGEIFKHRCIKNLFDYVIEEQINRKDTSSDQKNEISSGDVELSWYQLQLLKSDGIETKYNHIALELSDNIEACTLVREIIETHDSFRLHFDKIQKAPHYKQYFSETAKSTELKKITLPQKTDDLINAIKDYVKISVKENDLYQFLSVEFEDSPSKYLITLLHPLIADSRSLQLLKLTLQNMMRGQSTSSSSSMSYRKWSATTSDYSKSNRCERNYWNTLVHTTIDNPYQPPIVKSFSKFDIDFDLEKTSLLLNKSCAAYNTTVHELLLSSLSIWLAEQGIQGDQIVHLYNEARALSPELDFLNTMGNFIVSCPILLSPSSNVAYAIKSVKDSIRSAPSSGIGFNRFFTSLKQSLGINVIFSQSENYNPNILINNESLNINILHEGDHVTVSLFGNIDNSYLGTACSDIYRIIEDIIEHTSKQSRSYLTVSDLE